MEYVGAIISRSSINSEWVKKELDIAMNQEIQNKRVKVLPLLLESCQIPTFLVWKLHADFTRPENYHKELEKIVKKVIGKEEEHISINHRAEKIDDKADYLSHVILPSIIIEYCSAIFDKFISTRFKIMLPRFYCDAQVIVCRHDGVIRRHPRMSSIGHNARSHEGLVIWSSFSDDTTGRPFNILFRNNRTNGWVVWADQGYSQLYLPISSRSNSRICLASSHWSKKRVYILEVHHELNEQIEREVLIQIGYILGERIKALFKRNT